MAQNVNCDIFSAMARHVSASGSASRGDSFTHNLCLATKRRPTSLISLCHTVEAILVHEPLQHESRRILHDNMQMREFSVWCQVSSKGRDFLRHPDSERFPC